MHNLRSEDRCKAEIFPTWAGFVADAARQHFNGTQAAKTKGRR